MPNTRRALLSVSDKSNIVPFARGLSERGYELVSTGGTAKLLRAEGLDVTPVSEITGFPEILSGRVKTLHPVVHGGILFKRDNEAHAQELKRHEIDPIDVVAVNLYPFAEAIARPEHTLDDALENIDIGGPTMIRGAAKNHPGVITVVDPSDYDRVLDALSTDGGATPELRLELAAKAFAHTAAYDGMIANYLTARTGADDEDPLPERLELGLGRKAVLRYGENPHQRAAFYVEVPTPAGSVASAEQLHGKELSFNNILDLDAAWRLATSFEEPTAAVIKHTNPCGISRALPGEPTPLAEIYRTARECDALSAFGGVVAINRAVDAATATVIKETFIEAVIAPEFEPEAVDVLRRKKNLRLLAAGSRPVDRTGGLDLRRVDGGLLAQDADRDLLPVAPGIEGITVATTRQPSEEEWAALDFAWKVCRHVKSNAIVYAKANRVVGVGAGQMSRVDAAKIAAIKAGDHAQGSVCASDAFFPFADGVEAAAAAGATAVVQPGGSVRDEEVIEAANRLGLTMVFTGARHFRH